MDKQITLDFNKRSLPMNVEVYSDSGFVYAEATFAENEEDWKQLLLPEMNNKNVIYYYKDLTQIYQQLEEKLTNLVKENYNTNLDWKLTCYDKTLLSDNCFCLAIIEEPEKNNND